MISTLVKYQTVTANLSRSLEVVANDPSIERRSQHYLENIRDVKTIDDFLENDRLYSYAMKAMGLEEMTYAKAFMRKVLEEGIDDRDSFANRLNDKRYRAFAEVFDFRKYAEATTTLPSVRQDIVDAFNRQTLEEREGDQNEGVRLALYFSRKAGDIDSAYQLLGDRALAETVYTALGVAKEFALSDIDKQAEFISERIDIEKLKDPEYVKKFLERFTALYDLETGAAVPQVPNLVVTPGAPATIGFGTDLMSSIQNFKLGG